VLVVERTAHVGGVVDSGSGTPTCSASEEGIVALVRIAVRSSQTPGSQHRSRRRAARSRAGGSGGPDTNSTVPSRWPSAASSCSIVRWVIVWRAACAAWRPRRASRWRRAPRSPAAAGRGRRRARRRRLGVRGGQPLRRRGRRARPGGPARARRSSRRAAGSSRMRRTTAANTTNRPGPIWTPTVSLMMSSSTCASSKTTTSCGGRMTLPLGRRSRP
jgi:hypothetical protein